MKLWRATSDRKWRDRKEDCPGGGVEYVARKAAEDVAREAALEAAESLLIAISMRSNRHVTKGAPFELPSEYYEVLAQLRALKEAEDGKR